MKEGAEAIAGLGTRRGDDPVFVKKGVSDDMEAFIAAADIAEGKRVGVFAVIENGGSAPREGFPWVFTRGGVELPCNQEKEDAAPEDGLEDYHVTGEGQAMVSRACAGKGLGEGSLLLRTYDRI